MSTMTEARPAKQYDLRQIESTMEHELADQLRVERGRITDAVAQHGIDLNRCETMIDDFIGWCDHYGLPSTGHTMACYLVELHKYYGASYEELRDVACAYLLRHAWDVRVPITAALAYVETAPRSIEARAALH
jgi:hypothetical protein